MFAPTGLIAPFIVLALILLIANASVKVLREYERAVVFTLGRFTHVGGPGLIFLIPIVQQIVRVDLRTVVMEVPSQVSSPAIMSRSRSTPYCTFM